MALIMAIGIMTVLAISGTTMVYYSTSNSGSANRAKASQSAYSLAEGGIAEALSILNTYFQPATASALPACNAPRTVTLSTGTYTYCGSLSGTTWTITSIGSLRNPAAKGNVTRTLSRSISIAGINSGATTSAWSRIYNDDATGCFTIPGAVVIPSPLATKGDLCVDGAITGATTKVWVGGDTTVDQSSSSASAAFDAGAGSGWTNSSRVTANDASYATTSVAAAGNSANLDATAFGFGIPSVATINGVTVKVERASSAANALKDQTVQLLKNGAPAGSNKATATFWGTGNGTTVTYGSANDGWSASLTPADVNAGNFGVRVQAHNFAGSAATASVDYVEVTVTWTVSGSIGGNAGNDIADFEYGGVCYKNANQHPCNPGANIYALTYGTDVATLSKPVVDFTYWYNNAAPGPKHGCDVSSGTPPVFDSNATYDGGGADQWIAPDGGGTNSDDPVATSGGTTPTTPSYTCIARDAQGNTIGQLSWNNATRVLTVSGTIFFDAQVLFHNHNGFVVHYQGRATIYASKGWHNDEAVCAGGSGLTTCRNGSTISNWDPTQNLLVLILGDKNNANSDDCNFHTDYSAFQGVIWAKNKCSIKDTAMSSGPILANKVDISGTPSFFAWPPLGAPLAGQTYGSTATSSDFLVTPGNQSG